MADAGCSEAMQLLNLLFSSGIISNDGHEIYARLSNGDDVADIVDEYAKKFGKSEKSEDIRKVLQNWPPLQLEAVGQMVQWALGKLDTEDRVTIKWKGDDENPETFTKFELRDHTLLIEFAHPPAGA